MANYEKQTDFIIANLLQKAGIAYTMNGSNIKEIEEALKTGSKRGTGKIGFPEFVAQSDEFIIVIEDKADNDKQAKYINDKEDTLLMDKSTITNYAENGALHYALHIIENTNFKKIFAFGCSGTTEDKLIIRPIFVNKNGYKIMPKLKGKDKKGSDYNPFEPFNPQNIKRYYEEKVLNNKTPEQAELETILKRAGQLHEDLRNYGHLGETEKPLVVSAILLALQESNFDTQNLIASQNAGHTDGDLIFYALSAHMDKVHVQPQVKKDKVLDQFRLIKNRPHLSEFDTTLGKSPLRYFAEYLYSNILTAICNNSPEDVLGRFYGEFIRYSGGDGQSLGVVLTPKHITELFTELISLKPDDKVFDPCCGTGGFLIAAMHKMLLKADKSKHREIKRNNLHGIELRDDMFSIATTNMILRGDGKSNLICADFLKQSSDDLYKQKLSVGFMNPPYSQGKTKATKELTELKFICHLLDSLGDNARCVVIVPQSTMVGKTKEDYHDKRYILNHHTLEGVITLNPQTFFGVGVNPVIAVFTAHQPHPINKYAKFINFKDDGFEVFPHLGLLPTVRFKERKKLLLDCWLNGKITTNDFMVTSTVEPGDEWLHSFYYFNEDIPSEADFEKTMADYLTFEFNMISHGRGYLFGIRPCVRIKMHENNNIEKLENKKWKEFFINKLFLVNGTETTHPSKLIPGGNNPRITCSATNNGLDDFYQNPVTEVGDVLTVDSATIGFISYQENDFLATDHVEKLIFKGNRNLGRYLGLFIKMCIDKSCGGKYGYGYKFAQKRIERQIVKLPVNSDDKPDYEFMEKYMQKKEYEIIEKWLN